MKTAGSLHQHFNPADYQSKLLPLLQTLTKNPPPTPDALTKLLKQHTKQSGQMFKKTEVLKAFRYFHHHTGINSPSPQLLTFLRKKPIRSLSGVSTITVLTKPFPCPGQCIFCPSDIRMPKSYISSEPGAQRAANNFFDPYLQTYNRLLALQEMGHPVQKAEVIVLGGTWSVYPLPYKIWFIKRIFEALNDFGQGKDQRLSIKPSIIPPKSKNHQANYVKNYNQAYSKVYQSQEITKKVQGSEVATWKELEGEQQKNQTASVKCVGLVLESRPDVISKSEVLNLRRLGATKTQIGLQSLQDSVLTQNKRGHSVNDAANALALLRAAGFKIHAHWMPNLYGSNVDKDKTDYQTLFSDNRFKPDELKIYPCSLIPQTELVHKYREKKWRPYSKAELTDIISFCLTHTPAYCRLTRIIRDIPGDEILVGNKMTNFRQLAQKHVNASNNPAMNDIRAREIKNQPVSSTRLKLNVISYSAQGSTEQFLEYVTPAYQIAGFLRLSLPDKPINPLTDELNHSALIREVHVYGQSLAPGKSSRGRAQHTGLGKKLISHALKIAKQKGFENLAVISAIGTREYYQKLGFTQGKLYQHLPVSPSSR